MSFRRLVLHALALLSVLAGFDAGDALAAEAAPCLATKDAEAAYRRGEYALAADLYDAALVCGGEGGDFYDAACAKALAGRVDAAFEALGKAVAGGMLNRGHLERDTDLASLRADPRWSTLLAAVDTGRERERHVWGGAAFATAYRDDLPADEKIAGLSRLWAEARSNFANFDLVSDLDWDAAFVAALPRVRATASTGDYYRELLAFVALLRDGHTGINLPAELRPGFYSRPPIATRKIGGKVLVTDLFDPALAASGVAPGMEIVAIDGEPVERYAERAVRPYQAASTPQDLEIRVYFQSLLRGAAGSRVRLRLADSSGAEREVALERLEPARRERGEPRPAVILLDLKPARIDGLAVFATAAEGRDARAARAIGINSYIVKAAGFGKFLEVAARIELHGMVVNAP